MRMFQVMEFHYNLLHKISYKLMSMVAICGGADPNYFSECLGKCELSTLRTIMYPKRDSKDIPLKAHLPYGKIISTPEHADSGYMTLLQTFDYQGLELLLDNIWYQVPNMEDCLVVNIGETMTKMSNGRFKSTIHRVMDIGENR